jgi:hypothetical protein
MGKQFSEQIVSAVLSAKAALARDQIDQKVEQEFWLRFADLSRLMQPASIEGIRETRPYKWHIPNFKWLYNKSRRQDEACEIPEAYISVRHFTLLALLLLIVVLIVQITISQTSLILDTLMKLDDEARLPNISPQAKNDYDSRAVSDVALLRKINMWTNPWLSNSQTANASDTNITAIERARLTVLWMSSFLLPVFVGGLGAAARVLRTLAQQIHEDSYSSEGRVQFRVWLALGLLAGVAVGLLFAANAAVPKSAGTSPESGTSFGLSIAPLALPFIAGYSIEFFFSLLDRIIGAFKIKPS